MDFIEKMLNKIDDLNANDIIDLLFVNICCKPIERELLFAYPQFMQDIIFLFDMQADLEINGALSDCSINEYMTNMISALKNIQATNDVLVLQKIHDLHLAVQLEEDKKRIEEIYDAMGELYNEMCLYNDVDSIWRLAESYVNIEKRKL